MITIKEEIQAAAERLHLVIVEMNENERELLRGNVAKRFAQGRTHWLWEAMEDASDVQDSEAWKWIDSFVHDAECILFFNSRDEKAMFELSGSDLIPILDYPAFEFYVTNRNGDYLISFNHHDFLGASGTAKQWLENYRKE
jgi:hypothetical protein